MRLPNPPTVRLDFLNPEQQRRVILIALEVVYELGAGRDYSAFERVEFARMTQDEYLAFWTLLDSSQRRIIKDLSEKAHAGS